MRVSGFACDVCEVYAESIDTWFKVTRQKKKVDVCSAECLRKLGAQLKAVGDDGLSGAEDDEEPTAVLACEHCDRKFPTKQGLSMHITRSHKEKKS